MNNKNKRTTLIITALIILALLTFTQMYNGCSAMDNTKDKNQVSVEKVISLIKHKHNYTITGLPDLDMSKQVQITNQDDIDELLLSILDHNIYTYQISKKNGQNIISITDTEDSEKDSIKNIIIDELDRNLTTPNSSSKHFGSGRASHTTANQRYNIVSDSDPPASSFGNKQDSESDSDTHPSKNEEITSENTFQQKDTIVHTPDTYNDSKLSKEDIQQHSIYSDEIDYSVKAKPAKWSIKTNLLYDATLTVNLGVEYLISDKYSIDVPINWNSWTFSNNKRFKHVLIQPEFRYWKDRPLSGHFFGLHLHWAFYNVGKTSYPLRIKDRYQGWLAGAGLSYGYRWNLNNKFDIEAEIGGGYAYLHHSKYAPEVCGPFIKRNNKHYWGITKTAINIIYKF